MRVLHVIERLGRGGAARAMLELARRCRRPATSQMVLSLRAPDPKAAELARSADLEILPDGDRALARQAVADADIVHVHFWNTPELYAWLREPLPPVRVVLTVHVAGEHPAQVATGALLQFADFVIATCPYSLELPRFRELPPGKVEMVLESPDFDRLARISPTPCHAFTVGYVGTVGFVKIHPRLVEMSAAARLPGVPFVVCGEGDAVKPLARQAIELGMADRFEWRGYVEHVGAAFAGFDVFGYPLRADTYASSDLVLQEAMYKRPRQDRGCTGRPFAGSVGRAR
jgi:hypothetical protein